MATVRHDLVGRKIADDKDKVEFKILEANYRKQGGRKFSTADASVADRRHVESYIESYKHALGEKWTYSSRKGQDGDPITVPYYDPDVVAADGTMVDIVFPDKNGDVRSLNKQYMDELIRMEEAIEKKVDRITELCVISDKYVWMY